MDKALRLRVVSADREMRAMAMLKREAGWDGKYPIPVKWLFGEKIEEDLIGVNLLCTSDEDKCFWVGDAVSALNLYMKGYDLETELTVLAKRKTIKKK